MRIGNLVPRPRAFWVSGDRTRDALDEIKNMNQKILVPFDYAHAFKFNNGFWTCAERVTAVTNAGLPSDFSQRSRFLAIGFNQKDRDLGEKRLAK